MAKNKAKEAEEDNRKSALLLERTFFE